MALRVDINAPPIKNHAGEVGPMTIDLRQRHPMDFPPTKTPLLTYGLYPLVVGGAAVASALAVTFDVDRATVTPLILVSAIAIAMVVEWRVPLDRRWSMTKSLLGRRDLPYLTIGLVIERVCEVAVLAIATATVGANGFGPLSRLPTAMQVVVAMGAFDLAWYGYHRSAHRSARLWRIHGAHHTPRQLYVLMHGVFHPFDELVVRFVLALVVFRFGGFTPDAIFISLIITGTIGIISHINADVRLWAFNHLLVGPETHRVHHSAGDHANFGTVTTLWDQLFGTFVFSPTPPLQLGLAEGSEYPNPERFVQVLLWPLRPSARR
jgi:sterol desaturase/sphingolipid hydroxylase (fatty acid hydroxylase superfamily)